jgi:hypothetical protein
MLSIAVIGPGRMVSVKSLLRTISSTRHPHWNPVEARKEKEKKTKTTAISALKPVGRHDECLAQLPPKERERRRQ